MLQLNAWKRSESACYVQMSIVLEILQVLFEKREVSERKYATDTANMKKEFGVTAEYLPLCTTIVFVGRRSLKNEAEHNRCYSYSMRCK